MSKHDSNTTVAPATEGSSSEDRTGERSEEPILAVEQLQKCYGSGDDEVRAVEDVSFTVSEGSVVGLLGPNGAGKTTIIKSALGLVEADSGSVLIDGMDVEDSRDERFSRLGATLEGARNIYWRLSVRENMAFFASLQGIHPDSVRDRHEEYLSILNLSDRADEPVNDLSRGMKQKAAIACVLAREPSILFLDEPTLGLDVRAAENLCRELDRLSDEDGKTIVICSHDMDVIQRVCDRVLILHDGRLVADETVDELVDVFHSQAYEVTIEVDDQAGAFETLSREYEISSWSTSERAVTFEVTLPTNESIYRFMEDLEAVSAIPRSIDTAEPNVKDAYLHFTDPEEDLT